MSGAETLLPTQYYINNSDRGRDKVAVMIIINCWTFQLITRLGNTKSLYSGPKPSFCPQRKQNDIHRFGVVRIVWTNIQTYIVSVMCITYVELL